MNKGVPLWWDDALEHFASDPVMSACIAEFGSVGLQGRGDLFYTIVRSIIGQQISVVAAESIWNRFESMVGQVTPERVEAFTKEEIASCGITRPKSGYILGLAENADLLLTFPYDTATEPDIYSPKDIGLVNGIKRLFPEVQTMDEAEEVAKRWAPYRTMASWYLWRTLDPIPVEY